MDGLCLPVIRHIDAVKFIQKPVQTGSAQYLLKFPQQSSKAKSGLLLC